MVDQGSSAEQVPTLDVSAAMDWISLLHGDCGGYVHVCAAGDWTGKVFDLNQEPGLIQRYILAADIAGRQGIYLRMTTLAQRPGKDWSRGRMEDSSWLPGFWADMDIAGPGHVEANLPPDVESCKLVIARSHLPEPSLWVHSGGGVYPFWMLTDPLHLENDEARRDAQAASEAWHREIARSAAALGWKYGTGIHDLARVLRIPGTVNRKAGLERQCRIIDVGRRDYNWAELLDALAGCPAPEPPPAPAVTTTTVASIKDRLRSGAELSPLDEFEKRHTWSDILLPHGWIIHSRRGTETNWTRPGKEARDGISATSGRAGDRDRLYLFTTSTDLEAQVPLTKGYVYAHYEHRGDLSAAARHLRSLGYGGPVVTPALSVMEAPAFTVPFQNVTVPAGALAGAQFTMSTPVDEPVGNPLPPPPESDIPASFLEWDVAETATTAPLAMDSRSAWTQGFGWMRFDGRRWCHSSEEDASGRIGRWISTKHKQAAAAGQEEWAKLWRKLGTASKIGGLAKLARSITEVDTEAFDTNPYQFNCANGLLDLRDGSCNETRPVDRVTKVAGAEFKPDATHQVWDSFLEAAQPDPEMRSFLARLMGSSMFGRVRDHKLPIFTGLGGNGKGTFIEAVSAAFGDYATSVDPDLLLATKHARHLTFMMELRGRRLVFSPETERGRRLNEAVMKRLCGGDPIQANRMHRDPITFEPTHTLILVTNHLPEVSGDDPATWRRLMVVPWDTQFTTPDLDMPTKLRDPQVQQAILAWCYRGYLEYLERGLDPTVATVERTSEYQQESDTVGRFLSEMTERGSTCSTGATEMYQAFRAWALGEGVTADKVGSQMNFALDLKARGIGKVKHGTVFYQGVMLKRAGGAPGFWHDRQ